MSPNNLDDFQIALQQLHTCTILNAEASKTGQLRLLIRVPIPQTDSWLRAMTTLRRATDQYQVGFDLSKAYIAQDDGSFRWAWRVILQHVDLTTILRSLALELQTQVAASRTPRGSGEADIIRLNTTADRNRNVTPVKA